MSTPVSLFSPNSGETEALKALVGQKAQILGLFRTQITPDNSMTVASLNEWPGGGTYAQKALTNILNESAPAASQWYAYINGQGRAQADYDVGPLTWSFDAVDAAHGYSVWGVFAYCWVLPFDTGSKQIKVGDVIKGVTSLATGIVTGVLVESGSWGAGTAAGFLDIMTKTGTFQNNENITILGAIATVTVVNDGSGYAVGDILQITQAGGSGCKIVVLTVNAGAITTVGVIDGGTGYSAASALPTTHLTGSGDDAATITIASLATTAYAATNTGSNADALKKLLAVYPFTSGVAITTAGQPLTWQHSQVIGTGT